MTVLFWNPETYDAVVQASDIEEDDITYIWEVLPESTEVKEGGDYEDLPEALAIEGNFGGLKWTIPLLH